MKKEYNFSKGKRGPVLKPPPGKTRVTIRVECKGCQTSRDTTMGQIRRGLEQVPTLVSGSGDREVRTLVVATLMHSVGTTVYVVDPPNSPDDDRDRPAGHGLPYERTGKNTWRINDPEEFANAAWAARRFKLLNWAGQFASANEVAGRHRAPARIRDVANLELTSRTIAGVMYRGRWASLFPELGYESLRVFTGLQEDVLGSALHQEALHEEKTAQSMRSLAEESSVDAYASLGPDGTCLVVEGL